MKITTYKNSWLFENSWKLDFALALIFASIYGYKMQVFADSGGRNIENILFSMSVAIGSYIFIYCLSFYARYKIKNLLSWIWIGGIGSAMYAFNWAFVFRIYSSYEYSQRLGHSPLESLQEFLGAGLIGFIFITLLCAFSLILFQLSVRFSIYAFWLLIMKTTKTKLK